MWININTHDEPIWITLKPICCISLKKGKKLVWWSFEGQSNVVRYSRTFETTKEAQAWLDTILSEEGEGENN